MNEISAVAFYCLELFSGEQSGPASADHAMRSGESFAVSVTLSASRYVYVVQLGADGLKAVLSSPDATAPPSSAGDTVRVPADGSYLSVPDLDSGDQVCLLLSEQPLAAKGDPKGSQTHGDRPIDAPEIFPLPTITASM